MRFFRASGRRLKCAIVSIAFGASSAFGATIDLAKWKYVGLTSSGSIVLIEKSSIRDLPATTVRNFAVRQAWYLWEHSKDKSEKARTSKRLMRFDCVGSKIGTFAYASYAADGTLLASWNEPGDYDFKYQDIVPDSIGSAMSNEACADDKGDLEATADALERAADDMERSVGAVTPK